MLKMYIAVREDAPDYMVPTLVAHSVLTAHDKFTCLDGAQRAHYFKWFDESFRKVVVRATQREFLKIQETLIHHAGHENTICNAEPTCLVVLPVDSADVPNVLKYCKLWKPAEPKALSDDFIADNLPETIQKLIDKEDLSLPQEVLTNVRNYSGMIQCLILGYCRVVAGDTLSQIGATFGICWRELARINKLENPDLIFPGQLIRLR